MNYKLLIFLAASISIVYSSDSKTIVETSYGLLKGYQVSANNDNTSVLIFKSVPFAAPPVGPLRFRLPQPPRRWSGILDAREYSVACMSNSSLTSSPQKHIGEDCLYLNIFADQRCRINKCPVIFYIHGGGLYYDSAVMFSDGNITEHFASHKLVFVIPAFRLGLFGLLNFDNEDITPKNLGLYDLILALRWVRSEIHKFGGNAKQVTLMGHSSGGFTSLVLTLIPSLNSKTSADRLFRRNIVMSCEDIMMPNELSVNTSWLFAQRNQCAPENATIASLTIEELKEVVECLRGKPAHQLLMQQRAIEDARKGWIMEKYAGLAGVIEQSQLLPFNIPDLLRIRQPVSLMTGATIREFLADQSTHKICQLVAQMLHFENPEQIANECVKRYKDAGNISIEDQGLYATILNNARSMRSAGGDVYLYSYDDPIHSMHKEGLAMLLGTHTFEMNDDQKILAKLYPKYFRDFAKSGRPSKDWQNLHKFIDNYYSINVNVKAGIWPQNAEHFHASEMEFWLHDMRLMDWMISGKAFALDGDNSEEIIESNFLIYPINGSLNSGDSQTLGAATANNISYLLYVFGLLAVIVLTVIAVSIVSRTYLMKRRIDEFGNEATERTHLLTTEA